MRKSTITFFCLVLAICLNGCLMKRQVLDGNILKSASPTLNLQIDPALVYIGEENSTFFEYGSGSPEAEMHVAPGRTQVFYFVEAYSDKKIDRFVFVVVQTLCETGWYFGDRFFEQWAHADDKQTTELGGLAYNHCKQLLTFEKSSFRKYITDKSYTLSTAYMVKIYNRISNKTKNLTIFYGESIEGYAGLLAGGRGTKSALEALDRGSARALQFNE